MKVNSQRELICELQPESYTILKELSKHGGVNVAQFMTKDDDKSN